LRRAPGDDGEDRVVDRGRRGDDVPRLDPPVRVPTPVGDATAGLAHQQRAGGDVPRAEGLFEVAVEDAGRGPGQVEAGGTGPAEVFEGAHGPLEDGQVLA